MGEKSAPPQITARVMRVGRSAGKLLMIEYFMRQYPTLSEGLLKLVEQYEVELKLQGASRGSG
jgi:hypothetical protein